MWVGAKRGRAPILRTVCSSQGRPPSGKVPSPSFPLGSGRAVTAGSDPGTPAAMREVAIVSAALSLAGVLAYLGLLLWAAREDGREQERRDRRLPGPP